MNNKICDLCENPINDVHDLDYIQVVDDITTKIIKYPIHKSCRVQFGFDC